MIATATCFGKGYRNGLFDGFLLGWGIAGAYRPILLPFIHQSLDIASYRRVAGAFFEWHGVHPVAKFARGLVYCVFHQVRRGNRIEIDPISIIPFTIRALYIRSSAVA